MNKLIDNDYKLSENDILTTLFMIRKEEIMDRIVSVDKPKIKKSRWDIFVIHYENKNGEKYEAHMFEEEYNWVRCPPPLCCDKSQYALS